MVSSVLKLQRPVMDSKLLGVMSGSTQDLHEQHTRLRMDLVSMFDTFHSSLAEVGLLRGRVTVSHSDRLNNIINYVYSNENNSLSRRDIDSCHPPSGLD